MSFFGMKRGITLLQAPVSTLAGPVVTLLAVIVMMVTLPLGGCLPTTSLPKLLRVGSQNKLSTPQTDATSTQPCLMVPVFPFTTPGLAEVLKQSESPVLIADSAS